MLGSRRKPKLRLKAAESWGFLLWIHHVLPTIAHKLDGDADACAGAAGSLVDWMKILQQHGRELPVSAQESLCACVIKHFSCLELLGVRLMPKHHMWVHLTFSAGRMGNPRFYWTFLDESLNGKLKKILRRCHQAAFERRGLAKVWSLFGLGCHKRRRL